MLDVDQLVRETILGDPAAWRALQAALQPTIVAIARRHTGLRRKGLADLPGDVAEVSTATLERLAQHAFRNLKQYVERREDGSTESFDSWLYGAVDFVVRDHLRARFGRARKDSDDQAPRPSKRDLQTGAERLDAELEPNDLSTLSLTAKLTLAQIMEHVAQAFSPTEAAALRMYYLEGQSFEQLAEALSLESPMAAEQLVRRVIASRLRYRLRPEDLKSEDLGRFRTRIVAAGFFASAAGGGSGLARHTSIQPIRPCRWLDHLAPARPPTPRLRRSVVLRENERQGGGVPFVRLTLITPLQTVSCGCLTNGRRSVPLRTET